MKIPSKHDRYFEALVAQHWGGFWRYALRLCRGKSEDAEDLLSETLVDAYRAFGRFKGQNFDRWVCRMITTNHLDMLRRAKVRPTVAMSTLEGEQGRTHEFVALGPSVEELVVGSDVSWALADLPEMFRTPLLLCDVDGLEYEEISQRLHIPVGTVRSRIHRSRQRVREAVLATRRLGGSLQTELTP